MNVLSLFDGISCGQVALERAGIKVDNYYASEIDKYAIKIARRNNKETIHIGDVTNIKGTYLPQIDLIIGGSPCQGFSKAGKQLNFDDSRSKLFFEFVRLVKECKPKYFLLENVKMKKEWEKIITNNIGVEPVEINSKLVSAQKRKRLYWTNIENIKQPRDKKISLSSILEREVNSSYFILREDENKLFRYFNKELRVRQATKRGYAIARYGDSINLSVPNSKTRRGRVGNGKSNTLDTSCNYAVYIKNGYINDIDDLNQIGYITGNSQGSRIYDVNGKSVTLKALGGGWGAKMGLYLVKNGIRKVTPIECERLQTLPDNYTKSMSNSQRYKALGNGWTVDVISHIFKNIK